VAGTPALYAGRHKCWPWLRVRLSWLARNVLCVDYVANTQNL